jgi:hypothetical protein
MTIRQALRRQSDLASAKPEKSRQGLRGSTVVLAMMAALFAIVCAIEIVNG